MSRLFLIFLNKSINGDQMSKDDWTNLLKIIGYALTMGLILLIASETTKTSGTLYIDGKAICNGTLYRRNCIPRFECSNGRIIQNPINFEVK